MATLKPRFIAGGPDEDDVPQAASKPLRYPCVANGCPMPGTILVGGPGICGWHLGTNGDEFSRVTESLQRWECVTRVINAARRVVSTPATCADGKAQAAVLRDEWAALAQAVHGTGWKIRVEPQPGETIGEWGRRLEVFLAARVKGDQTSREIDETLPTPFVAEVRAGLREQPVVGRLGGYL